MMGSDHGPESGKPAHLVTVRPFQMARTEVTFGQYKKCMKAGACTKPGCGSPGDEYPVVCVDWHQAKAFSEWVGGRLPTEAEWEFAARGAGRDWAFPWGDEEATCERAVISDGGDGCGRNSAWRVCSKPAGSSAQGLCDMAGNVWEWAQDWNHPTYAGAPADGGAWETPAGSMRVIRGGSWGGGARNARAAGRYFSVPTLRYEHLGLRPARSEPPPGPAGG